MVSSASRVPVVRSGPRPRIVEVALRAQSLETGHDEQRRTMPARESARFANDAGREAALANDDDSIEAHEG